MKRFRGCLRIAGDEFRTQWHFYVVFLLSASVFFATLISILLVTRRIPDVLDEKFADSDINLIQMNRIPKGFLSTLEKMPVKIIEFPTVEVHLIGSDKVVYGTTGNVVPDKPNDQITRMNEALLKGVPWTVEENSAYNIWLSEEAAEMTGFCVGDMMMIPGRMNTEVSATVAGVYTRDRTLKLFYVTFPVYESIAPKMVSSNRVFIRPDSILLHNKVINEIKSYYYYAVSYSASVIDGYMALLFLLYVLCGLIGLMVVSILFATARAYYARRTRFFSVLKALGFRNRGVMIVVCLVTQGVLTVAFLISQFISPHLLAYVSDCLSELYFEMNMSTNVWNGTALCGFVAVSALAWVACFLGKRTFRTTAITELMRSESQ